MTTLTVLVALVVTHFIHTLAFICETVLEARPTRNCRRCCRIARWVSIFALAAIGMAYLGELYLHL